MTEPDEVDYDDHELLGQADWVIGGDAARKARQQGLYAGYVAFLGALVYGLPIVQAVFRTSDAGSLGRQLQSPVAVALLVASVAALLGAVVFAGRFRGPVVPPMPWIDLVLAAPLDRALALRRWWRYAAVGGLFLGALSGLTVGAGLAFARLGGVVTIIVTTVVGTALGVLTTRLWLWSQVRSWPGPDRGLTLLWRVPDALRELHAESLRAHSANTSTLAGSALTGNLRTARLALTRPVHHGRSARLRPGRPFAVLVRRDVLGPPAHPRGLPLRTRSHGPGRGHRHVGVRPAGLPRASPRRSGCSRSTSASARGRRGCACRPTTSAPRRCSASGRYRGRRPPRRPRLVDGARPRRPGRRHGHLRAGAGKRGAVAGARPGARRRRQRAGGLPRLPDVRAAPSDGHGVVRHAGTHGRSSSALSSPC